MGYGNNSTKLKSQDILKLFHFHSASQNFMHGFKFGNEYLESKNKRKDGDQHNRIVSADNSNAN